MVDSLRETILGANDGSGEVAEIPEWGCKATIAVMSGSERDAWEQQFATRNGEVRVVPNLRASLLVKCLRDESGKRIFSDADTDALGAKSAAVLTRLFTIAQRVNKLTKEDLEELEKNS